jgi:hypothetical protein
MALPFWLDGYRPRRGRPAPLGEVLMASISWSPVSAWGREFSKWKAVHLGRSQQRSQLTETRRFAVDSDDPQV